MNIRNKVASVMAAAVLASGLSVAAAPAASAADGVTPVCYFKKVVTNPGNAFVAKTTVFNVVDRQEFLQYPARTKRCFITQTKETAAKWPYSAYRRVIWQGSITVRY